METTLSKKVEKGVKLFGDVLAGKVLSPADQLLLADPEVIKAITEAAKKTNTIAKESKEKLAEAKINEHKETFKTWFGDLKKAKFETADDLVDYLLSEENPMPILNKTLQGKKTGTKGTSDGDWLKVKPITNPSAYQTIVYNVVKKAAGKEVTFEKLVTEITKVKGEDTTSAGYLYRVQNCVKLDDSGKKVGWLSNQPIDLVTDAKGTHSYKWVGEAVKK